MKKKPNKRVVLGEGYLVVYDTRETIGLDRYGPLEDGWMSIKLHVKGAERKRIRLVAEVIAPRPSRRPK